MIQSAVVIIRPNLRRYCIQNLSEHKKIHTHINAHTSPHSWAIGVSIGISVLIFDRVKKAQYCYDSRKSGHMNRARDSASLVTPGKGMTLCFCTCSYAVDWWPLPIVNPIKFWSIFVMTLTYNFHGQQCNLFAISQTKTARLPRNT